MANLFVVAYDDLGTAEKVREKLLGLQRERLIRLADVVVAERREDGKIKLHQAHSTTGTGAAGGALWGGLIGLIFLMPLLGMAVGAAAGAAAGAMTDVGVDDGFMKELGEGLQPGAAAVFALVVEGTRDKVIAELAPYGGQLVKTSLSVEQEEQLQNAMKAAGWTHA
ncbi:DUF1269 domain-containing protein [Streptosporangium sp. NPDC006007]|uniref:DUF1269 domain-containing protein n=1 Tax=Streptosporangium sp. NPDC006007 TaxID=3154575 RepID=UPI00339F2A95